MESEQEMLVRFRHGLLAFEQDVEFKLAAVAEWRPFLSLESLRPGGPRFICVEIAALDPGFSATLSQDDADSIDAEPGVYEVSDDAIRFFGVVASTEDGTLTANFAAPVAVNYLSGLAVQSIQSESKYSPATVILRPEERQSCS